MHALNPGQLNFLLYLYGYVCHACNVLIVEIYSFYRSVCVVDENHNKSDCLFYFFTNFIFSILP